VRLQVGFAAALAIIATIVAMPSQAGARARWPVIGCEAPHQTVGNHFAWRYKPSGLCGVSGSRATLIGIDHAHWRHWGRRRTTATGMVVYGLGFEYPARITVYGLSKTHDFLGQGAYVASYNNLHVVSRGGYSHGVHHGPLNLTLGVVPQE
jgi:hypothetical protein